MEIINKIANAELDKYQQLIDIPFTYICTRILPSSELISSTIYCFNLFVKILVNYLMVRIINLRFFQCIVWIVEGIHGGDVGI